MISSMLVVCVGNVCRSPMAEGILRVRLPAVRLGSAGIGALAGNAPEEHAISLMAERGIDISTHRARQLDASLCRDVEFILVMDNEQKRVIESNYTFACGRVFRLGHFGKFDVPDPYRASRETFAACGELIDRGISDWVSRIHAL
ncbi:MAG: low molecular weight phosphotyrosine protein phosphatase [Paraburkholderia sp.]|nr:low molecular weight phosphotyrosine protein phosphatase [Paraburkholderia sp.]